MNMLNGHDRARDALYSIPPDLPHGEWLRAAMGFHAAGGDFDTFNDWSAPRNNPQKCRDTWRGIEPDKGIGAGTLFHMARDAGWTENSTGPQRQAPAQMRPAKSPRKAAPGTNPDEVWNRCEAATHAHPYIVKKGAAGVPLDTLRVLPAGDALRIGGEHMAGALVVPVMRADGSISSLQFITPPEVAARLKAKGKTDKPNLPGASMEGWHVVGKLVPGATVHICEGIGAAWSCWQATGNAAVGCFGSGRMRKVAAELRALDASAKLVMVADVGKEQEAAKIAQELNGLVVTMPPGWPQNSDVNDLAQREGNDVLAALLESAKAPAPPPLPLSVVFADELPDEFTAPDELVEGVLTAGDGSVLYGDSNSGKTFVMIDMACAVARGVPWMGKRTEQGLVVYLAAESPVSVRRRLQTYQKHHGVKVPNFAIVQSPIDLFDGEADTDKVIEVVRQLEQQRGQKARLIIGDTLARLSAGANENAGQDMGLVVRRFDRIRAECKAHFCLIHHSGKNAAAGSRGWSGVRAAVDTEIEISDSPTGRCCEIKKQRDLGTKDERIGFRLDTVAMGLTKWGAVASSCVVVADAAPVKQQVKRMGEIEGAVLEFLAAHKIGIKRAVVVNHFDGRYDSSNVYRAIRTLVTAQAVHAAAGMVCIAEMAK